MIVSLRHFLGWLVSAFSSREDLVLENLALRRQLLALRAQRPLWSAKKKLWLSSVDGKQQAKELASVRGAAVQPKWTPSTFPAWTPKPRIRRVY
jgi:hypothetical protein